MYLSWSLYTRYLFVCQVRVKRRRLRSWLLCLCDVFRALINSLVCCCNSELEKKCDVDTFVFNWCKRFFSNPVRSVGGGGGGGMEGEGA